MLKVWLIDDIGSRVVDYDGSLDHLYELIGCEYVEFHYLNTMGEFSYSIICDGEGIMNGAGLNYEVNSWLNNVMTLRGKVVIAKHNDMDKDEYVDVDDLPIVDFVRKCLNFHFPDEMFSDASRLPIGGYVEFNNE
jgi:hypothetical protein